MPRQIVCKKDETISQLLASQSIASLYNLPLYTFELSWIYPYFCYLLKPEWSREKIRLFYSVWLMIYFSLKRICSKIDWSSWTLSKLVLRWSDVVWTSITSILYLGWSFFQSSRTRSSMSLLLQDQGKFNSALVSLFMSGFSTWHIQTRLWLQIRMDASQWWSIHFYKKIIAPWARK